MDPDPFLISPKSKCDPELFHGNGPPLHRLRNRLVTLLHTLSRTEQSIALHGIVCILVVIASQKKMPAPYHMTYYTARPSTPS